VPAVDFGSFFDPRAAVVASFGRRGMGSTPIFIAKGIWTQASQLPSNLERFGSEPFVRQFASPSLGRETARNLELSIALEPHDGTRFEASYYGVTYSDVLYSALRVDSCCTPAITGQYESIGQFHVSGLQSMVSTRWRDINLYANYSYTEGLNEGLPRDQWGDELSFQGQPIDRLPIGDIARHKGNFGGSVLLWRRFDTSLRGNIVGARPTGAATTSRLNGTSVPAYMTMQAAVAYRDKSTGVVLQLTIDNLLNAQYSDAGVRSAESFGFAGRIPQPGIAAYVQLSKDFNVATRRRER